MGEGEDAAAAAAAAAVVQAGESGWISQQKPTASRSAIRLGFRPEGLPCV